MRKLLTVTKEDILFSFSGLHFRSQTPTKQRDMIYLTDCKVNSADFWEALPLVLCLPPFFPILSTGLAELPPPPHLQEDNREAAELRAYVHCLH